MSQTSHRYSPYTLPSNGRSHCVPLPQSYTTPVTYSLNTPNIDYSAFHQSNHSLPWDRTSYTRNYGSNYDNAQHHQYATQPPAYMLPSTDPMATFNACYLQPQFGRTYSGGMWSESQNLLSATTVPIVPSQYSYSGLDTSLNIPGSTQQIPQSIERTLPTPMSGRSHMHGPMSLKNTLPMTAFGHRSSSSWQVDAVSSSSNASTQSTGSASQDSSTFRTNESISSAGSGVNNLTFGYLELAIQPDEETLQAQDLVEASETNQLYQGLQSKSRRTLRDSSGVIRMGTSKQLSPEDLALTPPVSSASLSNSAYYTYSNIPTTCGYSRYSGNLESKLIDSMRQPVSQPANGDHYRPIPAQDPKQSVSAASGISYLVDEGTSDTGGQKRLSSSAATTY